MKKIIKKFGVLFIIFVIAVAIYFVWAQSTTKKEDIVYTSMEEATLPVVYADMFSRKINTLHGYLQEMGQSTARESLTILPEDRKLSLRIDEYGSQITKIHYEIRSLDLKRLVERTSIEEWNSSDGVTSVVLPIQNLLSKEQEYLLDLSVETSQHGIIHYYTRVIWTDNQNAEQMISFAVDFSSKTFDYNQARELVTYLETNDTEDNSSLGFVTIRSSFSQLTWGGLEMEPMGDVMVTLRDLDGIMGNVQLDYMISRQAEDGETEVYEVCENFTMKWNTQRIYLMDYTRKTNQVFSGSQGLFSGKRIMLGITNNDKVRLEKSANGNFLAFVSNRDLWCYNQQEQEAMKIFSFRSSNEDGVRSNYNQHDVKVLSMKDNGNVDFLVYGYMNRGEHEGTAGITFYRYDFASDVIEEKFFVPVKRSFEVLKQDLDQLSYLGSNEMLYMLIDHAVYGIDLNSNEYIVVADALTEDSYAVSQDGRSFAWQEGGGLYSSKLIHLMDLESGQKQEIAALEDELLRVLGFVGNDFVYGLAREGDQWMVNGRVEALPMYAMEVLGSDKSVETRYEKDGLYLAYVTVEDSRIHLNRVAKLADQEYTVVDQDTLVCNMDLGTEELAGIGWFASSDRRKLYFVQTDQEIKHNNNIKVSSPKRVFCEAASVLNLKANAIVQEMTFYAYGAGHFIGSTTDFSKAIQMAYGKMGVVTDKNQRILWNRVERSNSKNIKDPQLAARKLISQIEEGTVGRHQEEDLLVLDARGCSLPQMLYFIDKGCPVAAFVENGSYLLISGFDQYNVTIYNPATGQSAKMGLNDATEYFKNFKNDFICGVFTD